MSATNHAPVRMLWHLLEPIHAVLYYAPALTGAGDRLGYATDTRWPGYFAWRAAPLGPVGAERVTADFHSFSPRMVATHVPAAWDVAAPAAVLAARTAAVDRALRALLGPLVDSPDLAEASALARRVALNTTTVSDGVERPLAAANAALPWPTAPHLVLWQAATILREHRGDGHVAALREAGLDGCAALVSFAAVGAAPAEVFASRGWTDAEWSAARDKLARRGWVDATGTATAAGRAGRQGVEDRTDALAARPWSALDPAELGRFARLTAPVTMTVARSGLLPAVSTLGIRPVAARDERSGAPVVAAAG